MDLSTYIVDRENAGFVHLRNPITNEKLYTEDEKPIGLKLYGIDSPQFKKHQLAIQNQELESRRKGNHGIRAEDLNERLAIKSCFHSFVNVVIEGVEYTKVEQIDDMLDKLAWSQDQLLNGMGSRENFMPALSK